jgi:hypothetical protein
MSGTLRSTLDVFQQYPDAEIVRNMLGFHFEYQAVHSSRPSVACIFSQPPGRIAAYSVTWIPPFQRRGITSLRGM